jgi:hypothetical protein
MILLSQIRRCKRRLQRPSPRDAVAETVTTMRTAMLVGMMIRITITIRITTGVAPPKRHGIGGRTRRLRGFLAAAARPVSLRHRPLRPRAAVDDLPLRQFESLCLVA